MSESEDSELARLLEAMALPDCAMHLSWSPLARSWQCSWVLIGETIVGAGATPAAAVRACWERGQG